MSQQPSAQHVPVSAPKDTASHSQVIEQKDTSLHPQNAETNVPIPQQLGKRDRDNYALDEQFYESKFKWSEDGSNKKIKLDTPDDRREALNARPSFTNLASSISLILPPEIDTVVITRDKFVVEWNDPNSTTLHPPTQVKQVIKEDRKVTIKDVIHRSSFNIPLYYCNSSTSDEIINKIKEEK